jgi:hypothetical protein
MQLLALGISFSIDMESARQWFSDNPKNGNEPTCIADRQLRPFIETPFVDFN